MAAPAVITAAGLKTMVGTAVITEEAAVMPVAVKVGVDMMAVAAGEAVVGADFNNRNSTLISLMFM